MKITWISKHKKAEVIEKHFPSLASKQLDCLVSMNMKNYKYIGNDGKNNVYILTNIQLGNTVATYATVLERKAYNQGTICVITTYIVDDLEGKIRKLKLRERSI